MPKRKYRVITDTNLWVSFLLTNELSAIDTLLDDDIIVLLFSQELLDEFIEVASRSKFRKYFGKNELHELLSKINNVAEFIEVKSIVNGCRDPKDNFLLSLAKDGKADYLITGDKDLLILKKSGKTEILTFVHFLRSMKS